MKKIFLLTAWLISYHFAFAGNHDSTKAEETLQKMYTSNSFDGGIFSTALISHNGANSMGTLRFSYILNGGVSLHYNFDKHIGVFTGFDVKNIGFIEKFGDLTVKRRTYNIGIPVGLKFGNMAHKGHYGFIGGGVDAPINYKEKQFTSRSHKAKFNEWFSPRTPAAMPYLFAGARLRKGLTLKVQYYPGNFLNPNYKDKTGVEPYSGYDVNILYFSVGYTAPGIKKKDKKAMGLGDLQK